MGHVSGEALDAWRLMCLRAQALDDDDDDDDEDADDNGDDDDGDGDGDGDEEQGSPPRFSIIPQVPLYIRTSMKKSTIVRP